MSDEPNFFEKVGGGISTAGSSHVNNDAPYCCEEEERVKLMMESGDIKRWSYSDDLFWGAHQTVDTLDPGFYGIMQMPGIGTVLNKKNIVTDNLIRLPDSASESVIKEFDKFWGLHDKFKNRGFLHKRGILLWGPPGSGKTASLMLMSNEIIKQNGIVIQLENPDLAASGLSLLRKIEPDRPVVALLEDIDALVNRYGENQYLALLDGETQVDKIVYIATTNYPEKLDKRFVDRPSRFDTIRWIGMPTPPARYMYLSVKEPSLTKKELEVWVNMTEGFSVAHLRELVILVQCFGETLENSIARLETMRMKPPSSEDSPDKQPLGFFK